MVAECYLFCPVCGPDRPAELPARGLSDDAHDDERLCIDCGAAVFVDPLTSVVPAA